MEQGETLHLARGTTRGGWVNEEPVGIENASTRFGPVSYRVRYDQNGFGIRFTNNQGIVRFEATVDKGR